MLDEAPGAPAFLRVLGERVREERARRGMSRKALANDSGVSERYLALLEAGNANASIVLLRDVAAALGIALDALVGEGAAASPHFARSMELLRRLPHGEMVRAHDVLARTFGAHGDAMRTGRIALIGLRGAGKSTLGKGLAAALAVPFVELDREIEREGGTQLATIFDLYGQPGFRRFEREALERTLQRDGRFVLEAGGGIVSEPATFARLRATCFTIWIRASAREHMSRVLAQGDTRPMGGADAMADLQRILASREALYGEADATLDTTGRAADESAADLRALLPGAV